MEKNKYQPFADLLKESRKSLGYSQCEVCALAGKDLNLSQRTLSAWENGKQLPDKEKESKLSDLANALKLDFSDLEKAFDRQSAARGTMSPQGLAKEELLDEAQDFVRKIGADRLDLWLLEPQNLPVCEDDKVEKIWINNLKEGCTYNLIWFLDQITSRATFNKLSNKIEGISKKIPNNNISGKITNYALFLLTDEANLTATSIKSDYERLCGNKNSSAKWIHPFTVDSIRLQKIKNEILSYWQCTSSIILYSTRAKAREIPSKAALHLKNFYLDLDESEVVSPFLWYASEHVNRIEEIVVAIQNLKTD